MLCIVTNLSTDESSIVLSAEWQHPDMLDIRFKYDKNAVVQHRWSLVNNLRSVFAGELALEQSYTQINSPELCKP